MIRIAISIYFFFCCLVLSKEVDFENQVKPIFKEYCIKCHGPDKKKADLRLDTPEFIRKGSKRQSVVLAGKPKESELLKRVKLPADHDDAMPGEGKKLKSIEISLIEQWLLQGADLGDGKKTSSFDRNALPVFQIDKAADKQKALSSEIVRKYSGKGVEIIPVSTNGLFISISYKHFDKPVNREALVELSEHVVRLDVTGKELSSELLNLISQMPNLQRLSMQYSKFSEESFTKLTGLENLEYLNLYSTQVSDKTIPSLLKFKSLKKLYIAETGISKEGVAKLRLKLPKLKVVINDL